MANASTPSRHPRHENGVPKRLNGKKLAWILAGIAIFTAGTVAALWWAGTRGLNGSELVTARLEALKIGLSIGLAGGGILVLYLAWRRQRSTEDTLDHQQEVARITEVDATERRITDLYTKAIEQLGSDKAPVRLGGLYALERLAQNYPVQRFTIVSVLCAYLRMPYVLMDKTGGNASEDQVLAYQGNSEEREVRLTAQRLLHIHLQPDSSSRTPSEAYWGAFDLDLTGAMLINFDLSECLVNAANFERCTFFGRVNFERIQIAHVANFVETTFKDDANFDKAIFIDRAIFSFADFQGDAAFIKASFRSDADFRHAKFLGATYFANISFTKDCDFREVEFMNDAYFANARFDTDAYFREATVRGDAYFSECQFSGHAVFSQTTFQGRSEFNGTTFTYRAEFMGTSFNGDSEFYNVTFRDRADFQAANFADHIQFLSTTFVDTPFKDRNRVSSTSEASHQDVSAPYTDFRSVTFKYGPPQELSRFM